MNEKCFFHATEEVKYSFFRFFSSKMYKLSQKSIILRPHKKASC